MVADPVPPCTCLPENSDFQQLILSFYDNLPPGQTAAGLAVGVISGVDDLGAPVITRCYSGYANLQSETLVAQETAFEIGSVSKTFTTTMLAKAVTDGIVDLCEYAQTYYDEYKPSVNLPVYTAQNGKEFRMRMRDLADYTSGIPHKSPTNTTAPNEYSFADMHTYLGNGRLLDKPGTVYKYVNTNFAIIAELLMLIGNFNNYHDALQNMITEAGWEMAHTGVIRSNTPSVANLAQGYLANGNVADFAMSTWPAFQGAGGIHATLHDMLYWLKFNLGLTDSSYSDLLPMLQTVYFPTGATTGEGLGWFVATLLNGATMFHKNGSTSGFDAWIGFVPSSQTGVVALCNSNLSGLLGSPVDLLGKTVLAAIN